MARNDAHIAPGCLERFGKKLDQGVVRQSVHRRSCHAYLQCDALQAYDLVFRRSRLEANRESYRVTSAMRVKITHIKRDRNDSMMLISMYARIGVMSSPPRLGTTRRRGASIGSLSR